MAGADYYGLYLNISTLLAVGGLIARTVWKVSQIEKDLNTEVNAQFENVQRDIYLNNNASLERAEAIRHEAGEMGAALRNKIHEVEVWSRDTMVRKDSFDLAISRLEKSLEKMTDKLEEKIDKAVERVSRSP